MAHIQWNQLKSTRMMNLNKVIFFASFFSIQSISAQLSSPAYNAEIGAIVNSESQKAFWMLSNNHGQFNPQGNTWFATLKVYADSSHSNILAESFKIDSTQLFRFDYGSQVIYNSSRSFQVQELFFDVQWKAFSLTLGAKKQQFGVQYQPLSAGGLLFSQNARPIPGVAFYSEYIPVPFLENFIEIKGFFSHGWLEKNRYVKSPLLHHKNLYARIGRTWPITIEYGFEHSAIWGGVSPDYGRLNNGIDDYLRVILATKGENIPNEILNVYGNHLGAQNLSLTFRNDNFKVTASWQTIFEDGSGKRMQNINDGLWGLYYHNQDQTGFLGNLSLEFMHTKHQSGRFHNTSDGTILGGDDDYFVNTIYRSGWTYHGYTIGTPFITSPLLLESEHTGIANNRVVVWHVGLQGNLIPAIGYKGMISYSNNYGRYKKAFSPSIQQVSWLLEFKYQVFNQWQLRTVLAVDHGSLYDSGLSTLIAISRTGVF